MIASGFVTLALALAATTSEPLRIGVLAVAPELEGSPGAQCVHGARLIIERWRADGTSVELAVEPCADETQLLAAIAKLDAAGVLAIVAPLDAHLAETTRRATRNKIACVSFATPNAVVAGALDELFDKHFQTSKIGLVHDASKDGKELAKLFDKGAWRSMAELALDFALAGTPKALARELENARPELVVVDGDPREVARFMHDTWAGAHIPLVFTPRTCDTTPASLDFDAWLILGRSPETLPGCEALRAEFTAKHGAIGFGMAEGYEALSLIQRALSASPSPDRAGVLAAVPKASFDGPRGRVQLDQKLGAIVPLLAAWRISKGTLVPYAPPVLPLAVSTEKTAVAAAPDPTLGVALGTWHARQFALEEDTQWVVCRWAEDPATNTIDDDLAELGLSTRGASPLFDHIVKDELMARIIAITNTKFLRDEIGTPIPGKSFKISFSTRPPKKGAKFWYANYGGDHPEAGGEAFGTFCNVYSLFIRRTIFQPHALTPPASSDDLKFVDGTYRYGTDRNLDKRSELIRALINGYAGSMALTTAHEVGHLCTLDHVTDDPADIMNVAEGAGLDHSLGHFGPTSYPRLVKVLGLAGTKK
jgi:hypothetical protein